MDDACNDGAVTYRRLLLLQRRREILRGRLELATIPLFDDIKCDLEAFRSKPSKRCTEHLPVPLLL